MLRFAATAAEERTLPQVAKAVLILAKPARLENVLHPGLQSAQIALREHTPPQRGNQVKAPVNRVGLASTRISRLPLIQAIASNARKEHTRPWLLQLPQVNVKPVQQEHTRAFQEVQRPPPAFGAEREPTQIKQAPQLLFFA